MVFDMNRNVKNVLQVNLERNKVSRANRMLVLSATLGGSVKVRAHRQKKVGVNLVQKVGTLTKMEVLSAWRAQRGISHPHLQWGVRCVLQENGLTSPRWASVKSVLRGSSD